MRKFSCGCGSTAFSVDLYNAGRMICFDCGNHFYWNGKEFVPTTRLNTIIYLIKRIICEERAPEIVLPQKFQEIKYTDTAALDKLILEEKKKAREQRQTRTKKKDIVLQKPREEEICWNETWYFFIWNVVQARVIKVGPNQHVGSLRGKHVLKEVHRRFNLLGLKSEVNYSKSTIYLHDTREKARSALANVTVWRQKTKRRVVDNVARNKNS